MIKKTVLLTISTLFLLTGCNENQKENLEQKIKTKIVKIVKLNSETRIQNWHEYPAQIFPYHNVNMAFELSGKIVEFNYDAGQRVKKGDILAKLDDTIYKSNLKAAQATYEKASADYERYKKLYNSKAITKNEYERASQNLDVQKALYDIAKKNLENTKLIAEFDGIIAKKNVDDFARIMAKQNIVILQDNTKYKVKFNIPENDILNTEKRSNLQDVAKNVDVTVSLGDDIKEYKATLSDISTLAQNVTRTYEVTVLIDNPKDKNVLPGMTAKVKIKLNDQNNDKEIFIPYNALFSDASKKSFVWSVDNEQKVHKLQVQTGRIEKNLVLITSGLNGNEHLVISGVNQLEENDVVQAYKKLGK